MKFKKLYHKRRLRPYREDQDGREIFYYEDKQTRLIIREITRRKEDIDKLIEILPLLNSAILKQEIMKMQLDDDPNTIWIVETKTGKLIASMDVTTIDAIDSIGNIKYYFKNNTVKDLYEQKLIYALYNVCQNTRIFEKLFHAQREIIYDINEDPTALVS